MFAKRLKELRTEKHISQAELATNLNLSNRTISMYEQGNSEPNVETLINIANFFNVSTDYLIGITNSKDPDNRSISDTLHLSDNAINILKELPRTVSQTTGASLSDVLNALIIHPKFISILNSILLYVSRTHSDWEDFNNFLLEQFSYKSEISEAKILSKSTITNEFHLLLNDLINNKIETFNHIEFLSDEIRISTKTNK